MNSTAKKILVVDDEEKIVEVLKAYLENKGFIVYVAYNGTTALEIYNKVQPSLIILDLMLLDITGEDICRTIRRKSRTPIIMLTAKADEEDILNGLNIGADELTEEAITFNDGYLLIDYKNFIVRVEDKVVELTPTEFKILSTLSKSPDKVFSRDLLVEYALDGNFLGYNRTIDTYIKNIRQKIEPNPKKPKFVITVHGIGYRFGGE